MRRPNVGIVFLGAILVLAFCSAPSQGAFIATETSSVNPLANGEYLYSYTVTVAANSTAFASEVDLALGGTIDTTASIINPNNFTSVYSPGDSFTGPSISFYATNDGTQNPLTIGISPGSSGTFSFLSTNAPTTGAYQILGIDSTAGIVTIQGSAIVPGTVPEPSSLLMSGLGVCGALGLFARSRRRPTV